MYISILNIVPSGSSFQFEVISLFENNDKDTVIESVYKKFSSNPEITLDDVKECYEQVLELKNNGTLFSVDNFEPMADNY